MFFSFANCSYFFKPKHNNLLPYEFNDWILNSSLKGEFVNKPLKYYKQLLNDESFLIQENFGANSHKIRKAQRKIKEIAKISGTSPKYGIMYQKLIINFGIHKIIELGTSLGIATAFFSSASPFVDVLTVEACRNTYNFTTKKFKENGFNNVKLINKTFEDFFIQKDNNAGKFDFAFIDGNHRREAILEYYKILKSEYMSAASIIVIDDINWSRDMYLAWKEICYNEKNATCLNLYRSGIIIQGYSLKSGNFSINFVKK